jgi:hypothetical protein
MSSRAGMYAGAIRGPVVLITLGGLLAYDHAGGMSLWQSWPVLIIAYGLMKLLELLLARPHATGGEL